MTKAFEDMLYLLGAAARGFEVSAIGMDMERIRECAIAQGVWPLVYKAAEKTADVSKWRSEYILTVAKDMSRKEFSLSAVRKLEKSGIECCLMKGAAIADLYALPECRISGDTDIYINPGDEKKAASILKDMGYDLIPKIKNEHHQRAMHPVGGLLEVHFSVFTKSNKDIIFNGLLDFGNKFEKKNINGYEYNVMGTQDELMFLNVHYIKHLVHGGCGIRQILDMLLFMEKNNDKIDFKKYDSLMKELRYDRLIDVVKSIGTLYFGYDYPVYDKALADKLLTDAENGGTFGFLADDRMDFYEMYCSRRTNWSPLRYWFYKWFVKDENTFSKVFPDKSQMLKRGYTYAKHTVLLPVAWIHRLFNLAMHRRKESTEHASAVNKSAQRLEMMKELNMID